MTKALTNQTVAIIGGTSGIGLATARKVSALGARTIVTGRDEGRLGEVKSKHPELDVRRVDAMSAKDVRGLFQERVDHLVLCVSGSKGGGNFRDVSVSDLREGFEFKFFAQFQVAQAALPALRPDGSVTFVSAISARAANPGTAGLAAINGAIEAMVKPLARELRPLRVNAVSPGVVETSWWDRLPPDVRSDLLQRSAAASLVGRNGTPEELADAIVFLIQNEFVTGTVLEVDGGMRLS